MKNLSEILQERLLNESIVSVEDGINYLKSIGDIDGKVLRADKIWVEDYKFRVDANTAAALKQLGIRTIIFSDVEGRSDYLFGGSEKLLEVAVTADLDVDEIDAIFKGSSDKNTFRFNLIDKKASVKAKFITCKGGNLQFINNAGGSHSGSRASVSADTLSCTHKILIAPSITFDIKNFGSDFLEVVTDKNRKFIYKRKDLKAMLGDPDAALEVIKGLLGSDVKFTGKDGFDGLKATALPADNYTVSDREPFKWDGSVGD